MAIQVQLRRGTTAQNNAFTGAVGEVTVDTDKDTAVVHDGATAGGFPLVGEKGTQTITGVKTFDSSVHTTADINGGTIDGTTIGGASAAVGTFTQVNVDNLRLDGNAITSTNTNGNIALTPNGVGEVDISKVDIDSGTIDGTAIGGSTAAAGSFTTLAASSTLTVTGAGSVQGLTVGQGAGSISTNTAVGASALAANTTGAENVAVGLCALRANTNGCCNVAVGCGALSTNCDGGGSNTAVGQNALCSNTTASNNTAIGERSLCSNTSGCQNTAVGSSALLSNCTGNLNTAVGRSALRSNTTGCNNVAMGTGALLSNTTASDNTASGVNTLCANTTGCLNTAYGSGALRNNTTGVCNTATGLNALFCNTTGSNNIGIGFDAGRTGCSPLAITTASNQVIIGNNSHNCFVAGCAWVTTSDCRDKTDVSSTSYGLNFVLALQPVEYKWDKRSRYGWNEETQSYVEGDGSQKDAKCSLGFLAQQVLEVEKQFAPNRNSIIVSDDDPLNLNMGETRIIPALVKAIQELAARVEQLENA